MRQAFLKSLVVIIGAACVLLSLEKLTWDAGGAVSAEKVRPVSGMSYAFDLPYQALGVGVLTPDINEEPSRSRLRLYEDGDSLPRAHSPHQEIVDLGKGRYSHWGRAIIFSASDGSDPRTNGRSYEYTAQARVNPWLLNIGWGLVCLGVVWAVYPYLSSRRREVGRVLLPFGLVVGSVMLVLAGVEIVCRLTLPPYCTSSWPSTHNPKVGFTFQPGAEVRWGGNKGVPQEFCITEQANSLGLLDRPVPMVRELGSPRIVLLGDSYLEAAQVKMGEKFHVLMEKTLAKDLGRQVQTVALGYSGMGTANLLAFWEEWGIAYTPDLVVLLVVFNDLQNNFLDMECAGYGWDPAHPPRLFFRLNAQGKLVTVPIDPEWRIYASSKSRPTGFVQKFDDFMEQHSATWRFLVTRIRMQPWARPIMVGMGLLDSREARPSLDEYKVTDYFNHYNPPAWALEALRLQGALLARFRDEVTRAKARLLVVYVPHFLEMTRFGEEYETNGAAGRFGLRGQRVGQLAEELGVPFLDLGKTFHARPEPWRAAFRFDQHWSVEGHKWAAEDISAFILHNNLLESRGQSQ